MALCEGRSCEDVLASGILFNSSISWSSPFSTHFFLDKAVGKVRVKFKDDFILIFVTESLYHLPIQYLADIRRLVAMELKSINSWYLFYLINPYAMQYILKFSVKKFKPYKTRKIYTPDELEYYDSLSFRFEKGVELTLI